MEYFHGVAWSEPELMEIGFASLVLIAGNILHDLHSTARDFQSADTTAHACLFKYANIIFKLKIQHGSLKVWVDSDALYFFFP